MQRVPPVLREQARGRVLTSNLISWLGAALILVLWEFLRAHKKYRKYRPQKPGTDAVPPPHISTPPPPPRALLACSSLRDAHEDLISLLPQGGQLNWG